MKKIVFLLLFLLFPSILWAESPVKSKFYDFSDQLIDGEIKKPHALYIDSRQQVRFRRLLRLKRNFIGDNLRKTSRYRIFK